jgi:hypothetical protein
MTIVVYTHTKPARYSMRYSVEPQIYMSKYEINSARFVEL